MFVFPFAVALYENMWFGQLGPGKAVYQRSKTANSRPAPWRLVSAPSEKPLHHRVRDTRDLLLH